LSEERFSEFSKEIVEIDESIRFTGITNKMGSLVATTYQKGIIPLMSREETSQCEKRPHNFEQSFAPQHGKILKLNWAGYSIPLENTTN
jgi:hypothetical protein